MDAQDEAVFRSAVAHVVAMGGPEVLDQPDRFGAMLSDMLGPRAGQLRDQRKAAVTLVQMGVAAELATGPITAARRTQVVDQVRAAGQTEELSINGAIDALAGAGHSGTAVVPAADAAAPPPPPPVLPTVPPEPPQPMPASAPPSHPTSAVPPPVVPASVMGATGPVASDLPTSPSPAVDVTPAPVAVATPVPVTPRPRSAGTWAAIVIGAALVAGAVAVLIVMLFGSKDESPTIASPANVSSTTTASTASTTTSTATSAPVDPVTSAQRANPALYTSAQRLDSIVSQSAAGRAAVKELVPNVRSCDVSPEDGAAQMNDIIANRRSVLNQLSSVPTSDPQAAALVSQLNSALQASIDANVHYANWMVGLTNVGADCSSGSVATDDEFQRGDDASAVASSAKQDFVAAYNPIAASFGLQTWDATQI